MTTTPVTTTRAATTNSDTLRRIAETQTQQAANTSATTTLTGSGSASDTRQLNQNFDMFLQLLTAQLKHQSPLDPMKTEQFTQQVTQYSAVEQQIKTNTMLERLIASQSAGANVGALGYLGNQVVARGTTAELRGGEATWSLNAPRSGTGTITLRNSAGAVVHTEQRNFTSGSQDFRWNGRNAGGSTQPDGSYSIAIEAKGADGEAMTVGTSARGIVTSVDFSGSEPVLTVAGARLKLSEVTSVTLAGR